MGGAGREDDSSPGDGGSGGGAKDHGWVQPAARAGYAAKGVVYAVIGGLALQQAIGSGGDTGGSREALGRIASAPFGRVLLGLVTVGLAGYVVWRLAQAVLDPEGDGSDDGEATRWAKRAFYLGSAVVYGSLAYSAIALLMGSGGGSSGGGGSGGGWTGELMSRGWGRALLGGVGLGIIGRGLLQFAKAYTESFKEKLQSFELGSGTERWVLRASRAGLTARGVAFGIIGGFLVHAVLTRDPGAARGLGGVLETLAGIPWLLGGLGAGFLGYALYQWVKARYRLLDV